MAALERQEGKKIDLLICCGDFQVLNTHRAVDRGCMEGRLRGVEASGWATSGWLATAQSKLCSSGAHAEAEGGRRGRSARDTPACASASHAAGGAQHG